MAQPYLLFWHWWGLALLLAALEMFLPGAAFLWIAAAAAAAGLIVLVQPGLPEAAQLALFGGLAVIAFILSRRFAKPDAADGEAGQLNQRGRQYIGQVLELEMPLSNGRGRVRLGDGSWPVTGEVELPAGARVRVVAVEGVSFKVVSE